MEQHNNNKNYLKRLTMTTMIMKKNIYIFDQFDHAASRTQIYIFFQFNNHRFANIGWFISFTEKILLS